MVLTRIARQRFGDVAIVVEVLRVGREHGVVAGIVRDAAGRDGHGLDRPAVVGAHAGQHAGVGIGRDRGNTVSSVAWSVPSIWASGTPVTDAKPVGAEPMMLPPVNTR